jgi:Mn-containing catalase
MSKERPPTPGRPLCCVRERAPSASNLERFQVVAPGTSDRYPIRGAALFFHHRDLAYTVRVDKPNPVFARMLQQAIGGPEGELRVMTQYLFQGFGHRGAERYRDMLLSTATEEIGHVEILATAVAMNLEGAKSEQVDEVVTNPAVAARMGALEPRHFLTGGLSALPSDANGVPFSAPTSTRAAT